MKALNNKTAVKAVRPERIIQFGEGNFLRAFVDWIISNMNEKTELLQEKADDLERVKRYAGAEQIDMIIGKVKEQERVKLQARRYKRSYEAR